MTPIFNTPDEFKQLVLAAMQLSAAGLAGDHAYGAELPESIEVQIPYWDGDKPTVPNSFLGSLQDLLWLFQDYCTVTVPRPGNEGRRTHERFTIERHGAPSSHQVIAASTLLADWLARIGVGQKQIAHILALS